MKGLKSLFGLLMLFVMASFLFTSCDQQKKELNEVVDKMNNDCPLPLGDIGSINSVTFDGETVEMKFTSNETLAPISSLTNHQEEVKEMMGMSLTEDASEKLIDLIIATGVNFRSVFVGTQTRQRAEFSMTADEFKDAKEKYSNMNDQQKLILILYIGTKIKLPVAIDEITKLVGLSLTSDALKYKFEVNDAETGQTMESAISFMKYVTLTQIANSLKEGLIGDRNKRFYQALVDCNQGVEYEYHELQTGKRKTFRISTDEIKEVLNGRWDNQLSAQDWENLGNALEEFEQSYGGNSLAYDDGVSSRQYEITLNGDAGGFPILLQLQISGEDVNGYYKNVNYGTKMSVSGTYKNSSMELSGNADGMAYYFTLNEKANGDFVGTFRSSNGRSLNANLSPR